MAIITKGSDPSARVYGRSVTFTSGVDFNVNDVIDIENSVGHGTARVSVEAGAGGSCTFRINSLNRRYPPLEMAKRLGFYAPDLQNEGTWLNSSAPEVSLTAGEFLELDIPVANVEFTAVVDTITVKVWS